MATHGGEQRPQVPPPSLWPVGFAVGIAILLTGLIVGWHIVILGAVLTVAFGFLWIRDATSEMRGEPAHGSYETRGVTGSPLPVASEAEVDRFPRSKFLEASTLGLGAAIGGIVTVPVAGFAVLPAFLDQGFPDLDIGALDEFPEGEWRVVTFMLDPAEGEVSRRTAFVRNNGLLEGEPSLTIISNRCAHLGCPVQPGGALDEDAKKSEKTSNTFVDRIPSAPANFSCPCHGGAYDIEGNRTSGPPVRALDRYEYSIRNGRLFLGKTYSVGEVRGSGKDAVIIKYDLAYPGNHVDGPEKLLYPIQPPR
jgi:menaquinol-cytochrome c reductase iron-sulfur subunit